MLCVCCPYCVDDDDVCMYVCACRGLGVPSATKRRFRSCTHRQLSLCAWPSRSRRPWLISGTEMNGASLVYCRRHLQYVMIAQSVTRTVAEHATPGRMSP